MQLNAVSFGAIRNRSGYRGFIIMKLSGELQVETYPGVDFTGLHGFEKPSDPTCTNIRTGFLINSYGCPVVWIPKL